MTFERSKRALDIRFMPTMRKRSEKTGRPTSHSVRIKFPIIALDLPTVSMPHDEEYSHRSICFMLVWCLLQAKRPHFRGQRTGKKCHHGEHKI